LGERLESLEGEALEIQLAHSPFMDSGGENAATHQKYPIQRPLFDGQEPH
jgi:hypothetical protein